MSLVPRRRASRQSLSKPSGLPEGASTERRRQGQSQVITAFQET
jgi:hypothetical protein